MHLKLIPRVHTGPALSNSAQLTPWTLSMHLATNSASMGFWWKRKVFAWGFKPQTAMCQLGVQNPKLTQTSKITNSKLTAFSNINKSVSLRFQKCPSRLALFLHLISIRNSRKVSGAIWGAKGIYTEGKPQPLAPWDSRPAFFFCKTKKQDLNIIASIRKCNGLKRSQKAHVLPEPKKSIRWYKKELLRNGLFP